MRKRLQKTLVTAAALSLLITSAVPYAAVIPAEGTWERQEGEPALWRYSGQNGSFAKSSWLYDKDGKTYYLDAAGAMAVGCQRIKDGPSEEKWYYFDGSGALVKGWYLDSASGKWYYLQADGVMVAVP